MTADLPPPPHAPAPARGPLTAVTVAVVLGCGLVLVVGLLLCGFLAVWQYVSPESPRPSVSASPAPVPPT